MLGGGARRCGQRLIRMSRDAFRRKLTAKLSAKLTGRSHQRYRRVFTGADILISIIIIILLLLLLLLLLVVVVVVVLLLVLLFCYHLSIVSHLTDGAAAPGNNSPPPPPPPPHDARGQHPSPPKTENIIHSVNIQHTIRRAAPLADELEADPPPTHVI